MAAKVLEVNVDDLGYGGVFALVKSVIKSKSETLQIDIASLEEFENREHITELEQLGTKVYFVGRTGNKVLKQFVVYRNLKKLLKVNSYDCVHIHGDVANKLLVSGLAAKHAKVKHIILHSHAAGVDGNHRKLKALYHKFSRVLLRFIGDSYLACSELAAEWMYPHIQSDKVIKISNGVNLETFHFSEEKRENIREQLGIEQKYVIGHVGRFAYQKNHEYLIEMFSQYQKQNRDAVLLLVGEGILEEKIRQMVKEKQLEQSVIFYGATNSVCDLYQAMDVFVLPSHFEGLPVVGVEAQACGLPVLFSDKITEEAKITDRVYFLPIEENTTKLWCQKLNEYKDLERQDKSDLIRVAGFSILDSIKQLEALYQKGD